MSSRPISGYVSKRTGGTVSSRNLHTRVHSSITDSSQEGEATQEPSSGWWISKVCSIHTTACYPVMQGKETLTPATTWLNTEDTRQSGARPSHEDKPRVTPLVRGTGFTGTERGTAVTELGEGNGGCCSANVESQFCAMTARCVYLALVNLR